MAQTFSGQYARVLQASTLMSTQSRTPGELTKKKTGSCHPIPIDDRRVDLVVRFETTEHLDDYRAISSGN